MEDPKTKKTNPGAHFASPVSTRKQKNKSDKLQIKIDIKHKISKRKIIEAWVRSHTGSDPTKIIGLRNQQ